MDDQKIPKKSNTLPLAIGIAIVVLAGVGYFANQANQKTREVMNETAPQAAATEPSTQTPQPGQAASEQASADPANVPADSGSKIVIAKVNGKEVLKSELDAFLQTLPEQLRQLPPEQVFALSQDQLVNAVIIDEKVATSNIKETQDYKDRLADVEKQLARGLFMQKELEASVTEESLKKAYDEYAAKLPKIEETKARHILVKDEAKAKEIIQKLKDGGKFEDLAKEFSEDKSSETGDLGYFAKSDMVPEFADAAFKLQPGSTSTEPVKTQFGWHVIKVEDRRVRPTPELKDVKAVLEAEIRRQSLETFMKDWKSKATVELFDINGKALQVPAAQPEQQQAPVTPAQEQAAPAPEAEKSAP